MFGHRQGCSHGGYRLCFFQGIARPAHRDNNLFLTPPRPNREAKKLDCTASTSGRAKPRPRKAVGGAVGNNRKQPGQNQPGSGLTAAGLRAPRGYDWRFSRAITLAALAAELLYAPGEPLSARMYRACGSLFRRTCGTQKRNSRWRSLCRHSTRSDQRKERSGRRALSVS